MTNSAGFTGAMPAMQISLPLSRSLGDIVVSSQATMKASSGCPPRNAPERHSVAQEERHGLPHRRPQRRRVRPQHGPLQPDLERLLDEEDQPVDVEIFPRRIHVATVRAP